MAVRRIPMATVQTLKDKNNDTFYPVTKTEAVYNADGSENLSVTLTKKADISTDAGDANKMMKADGTKALVGTSNIDDGAVTTAKLDDGAVTKAKIDWTTLTSEDYTLTDLPAHSGGTNNYNLYKKLNIGFLTVNTIWMNSITTSWTTIASIPEGIRPKYQHTYTGAITDSNGAVQAYAKVIVDSTNGNVNIRSNTSLSGLVSVCFTAIWSLD